MENKIGKEISLLKIEESNSQAFKQGTSSTYWGRPTSTLFAVYMCWRQGGLSSLADILPTILPTTLI